MATRHQAAQSIQRTARRGSNRPNGKSDKPYSQTTTDIHRRIHKIIDPLIELLNNTAGKDNYVIKQKKIDQVKVQTNTSEIFRKITRSLKEKKRSISHFSTQNRQKLQSSNQGTTPKNKYRKNK